MDGKCTGTWVGKEGTRVATVAVMARDGIKMHRQSGKHLASEATSTARAERHSEVSVSLRLPVLS